MATPAFVQGHYHSGSAGGTFHFASPLTPGNQVLFFASRRNPGGSFPDASDVDLGGVPRLATASNSTGNYRSGALFGRAITGADDQDFALVIADRDWYGCEVSAADIGTIADVDSVAASTTMSCGGAITPDLDVPTMLLGLGIIGGGDSDFDAVGGDPMTPAAGTTELSDVWDGFSPLLWVGSTTVADPDGTTPASVVATVNAASAKTYCGITVALVGDPEEPEPEPEPEPGIDLDFYDPVTGDFLGTITQAFDKEIRIELKGTGTGAFKVNQADADPDLLAPGNLCKVTIPRIWDMPIFAFFLDRAGFTLLSSDEEGGEILSFAGDGILAELRNAIWWEESFDVPDDIPGGTSLIYTAVTGNKPGQLLRRIISEFQNGSRPQDPIPLVTVDFDYTDDSDGNVWVDTDATHEMVAYRGDNGLKLAGQLIGTGAIDIIMDPDWGLHGYNHYGRDLTGAAFGADVVRFVDGVNIAEILEREVGYEIPATHALVVGTSPIDGHETIAFATLPDAASRKTRETKVETTGSDPDVLEAIGLAALVEALAEKESIVLKADILPTPPDEDAGAYLPGPPASGKQYWIGDTITVHSGDGPFDYVDVDFRIAAITLSTDKAANLDAELELNAVQIAARGLPSARGMGSTGGGGNGQTSSGGSLGGAPSAPPPAATLSGYQRTSERGEPDGYAELDALGHVPIAQIAQVQATTDPGVGDDSGDGYRIGQRWINTNTDEEFVAMSVAPGAAVWISTTSGSTPDAEDVNYDNATSGLTAGDVQAAIDELDGIIDALSPGGGGDYKPPTQIKSAITTAASTSITLVSPSSTSKFFLQTAAVANARDVSSVVQTNVTWSVVKTKVSGTASKVEIWKGVPTGAPGTTVTVTWSGTGNNVMTVTEWPAAYGLAATAGTSGDATATGTAMFAAAPGGISPAADSLVFVSFACNNGTIGFGTISPQYPGGHPLVQINGLSFFAFAYMWAPTPSAQISAYVPIATSAIWVAAIQPFT